MLSLKKTLQSLCLTSAMAKKNIPFNKECPDETVGFNRKKFEEMVEEKSKNPYVADLNISTASETPRLDLNPWSERAHIVGGIEIEGFWEFRDFFTFWNLLPVFVTNVEFFI